jgi:hypothetical protein
MLLNFLTNVTGNKRVSYAYFRTIFDSRVLINMIGKKIKPNYKSKKITIKSTFCIKKSLIFLSIPFIFESTYCLV